MGAAAAYASYLDYRRNRAMMNAEPPTSPWEDLIADNPKFVTVLAGMGALHQQGSTLPGRIAKGVVAGVKG